jgi:hypothetical protein
MIFGPLAKSVELDGIYAFETIKREANNIKKECAGYDTNSLNINYIKERTKT